MAYVARRLLNPNVSAFASRCPALALSGVLLAISTIAGCSDADSSPSDSASESADITSAKKIAEPEGAYAFAVGHKYDKNDSFVSTIMNDNSVDGVFIGFPWSTVAPTSTTTDFGAIDAWLDAAAAAGKKVSVGIEAGDATPSWVGKSSDYVKLTVYNFQQQTCNSDIQVPIPWHTGYLTALQGLINAFASHVKASPTRYATISAIKITGINDNTYETSLPNEAAQTKNGCTTTDAAAAWNAVGYTEALVESAWQTIVGYWNTAFPDKALCMQYIDLGFPAEFVNGKEGKKTSAVSTALFNAAKATLGTSRFVVEGTGLSVSGGPATNLDDYVSAGGVVGYQTLYYVYGDSACVMNDHKPPCTESVLHDAIDLGLAHGMKYIEIYEEDIAGYPAEVTYAHQQLVP